MNKVQYAVLYTRVSTLGQSPKMQETELAEYCRRRGWKIQRVYRDHGFSGGRSSRPALDQLLADCRKRKERIDVVLVWKFDRFARSVRQLANALEEFRHLGIAFVSATEAIDTSLPHGELVFQILGAIAQWERSLIAERVSAGLAEARKNGQRLGRPPLRLLTEADVRRMKEQRRRERTPFRDLAKHFGVSVWTAHRLCHAKGS